MYIIRESAVSRQVLLAEKLRGFGCGIVNGAGGKVEAGDATVLAAAVRETQEEFGITPLNAVSRGKLRFVFEDHAEWDQECTIFCASEFAGELRASEEMSMPEWHSVAAMPYDRMWPDDRVWMPELFAGEDVYYECRFSFDGKTMTSIEAVAPF